MSAIDSSYPAVRELTTHVVVGTAQVMAHASELDDLADSIPETPVTGRWPWIAASVSKPAPDETPWMVSVRSGHRITAAAVLLDDTSGTVRRTTLAGTADGHRGALIAVDSHQASLLGGALADALLSERREFAIGPVGEGPAVAALLRYLPIGLIVDEVSIPLVQAGVGLAAGVSHGTARTLRKARNRVAADEVRGEIVATSDSREIGSLLPLLERISRDRDHAGGRLSPLDDPARRRLWHRRIRALAVDGSIALSMLRLNGELAAYVLGVDDGDSYRVLEGRYVARWARYSPGRVLEAAVLHRAITDGGYSSFDWMTDVAPETLLASNSVDPLVTIRGRT